MPGHGSWMVLYFWGILVGNIQEMSRQGKWETVVLGPMNEVVFKKLIFVWDFKENLDEREVQKSVGIRVGKTFG